MLGKFVGTSLGIAVVGLGLAMTTANARTVPLTQLTMVEESADAGVDANTNDDSSTSDELRHYGGYYGGGYRYHGGYYGGYRYHGGYYGGYRHHGGYYGGYRHHGGYYGGGYRYHGGYHPRSATGEELGQMNLPQPRVEMD